MSEDKEKKEINILNLETDPLDRLFTRRRIEQLMQGVVIEMNNHNNSRFLPLTGGLITGGLTVNNHVTISGNHGLRLPVATGANSGIWFNNTTTGTNRLSGMATAAPIVAGAATAGSSTLAARADHVHPLQTTISGNAGSATRLQTPRTINGVNFDGTQNIELFINLGSSNVDLNDFNITNGHRTGVWVRGANHSDTTVLNTPIGAQQGFWLELRTTRTSLTDGRQEQLLYNWDATQVWRRRFNAGIWSEWVLIRQNNDTPAARISGTLAIGNIPTGTTATTVSLGNHNHTLNNLTGDLPISRIVNLQTELNNRALVSQAQMRKITSDNGGALRTISSGTVLAGLQQGVQSIVIDNGISGNITGSNTRALSIMQNNEQGFILARAGTNAAHGNGSLHYGSILNGTLTWNRVAMTNEVPATDTILPSTITHEAALAGTQTNVFARRDHRHNIANNAIRNAMINNGEITFAKLAAAAVGTGANQVAPGIHTHDNIGQRRIQVTDWNAWSPITINPLPQRGESVQIFADANITGAPFANSIAGFVTRTNATANGAWTVTVWRAGLNNLEMAIRNFEGGSWGNWQIINNASHIVAGTLAHARLPQVTGLPTGLQGGNGNANNNIAINTTSTIIVPRLQVNDRGIVTGLSTNAFNLPAIPGPGGVPSALGPTALAGTATTFSRADHVHARPDRPVVHTIAPADWNTWNPMTAFSPAIAMGEVIHFRVTNSPINGSATWGNVGSLAGTIRMPGASTVIHMELFRHNSGNGANDGPRTRVTRTWTGTVWQPWRTFRSDDQWGLSRTFTFAGGLTGNWATDGSSNINITANVANGHITWDRTHADFRPNANPSALGTAAQGTSTRFARQDHVHQLPNARILPERHRSTALFASASNDVTATANTEWTNNREAGHYPRGYSHFFSNSQEVAGRFNGLAHAHIETNRVWGDEGGMSSGQVWQFLYPYSAAAHEEEGTFWVRSSGTNANLGTWRPWRRINTGNAGHLDRGTLPAARIADGSITWNRTHADFRPNANPAALGTAAQGTSTRFSRQDHVHPMPALTAATGQLPINRVRGGFVHNPGTNINWNTVMDSGFYMINGADGANRPPNVAGSHASWWYLDVRRHNNIWTIQIAHDFNGAVTWRRTLNNDVWQPWVRVDGRDASAIVAGRLATARLPLSGVAAGTSGPTANASPGFGGTFTVPDFTVNAEGQVTARNNRTITLPAAPTTAQLPNASVPARSSSLPSNQNFNNLTAPGFYHSSSNANVNTMTNRPPLGEACSVQVYHHNANGNNACTQVVRYFNSNRVFQRNASGTSWGAWRELAGHGTNVSFAWIDTSGITSSGGISSSGEINSSSAIISTSTNGFVARTNGDRTFQAQNNAGAVMGVLRWNSDGAVILSGRDGGTGNRIHIRPGGNHVEAGEVRINANGNVTVNGEITATSNSRGHTFIASRSGSWVSQMREAAFRNTGWSADNAQGVWSARMTAGRVGAVTINNELHWRFITNANFDNNVNTTSALMSINNNGNLNVTGVIHAQGRQVPTYTEQNFANNHGRIRIGRFLVQFWRQTGISGAAGVTQVRAQSFWENYSSTPRVIANNHTDAAMIEHNASGALPASLTGAHARNVSASGFNIGSVRMNTGEYSVDWIAFGRAAATTFAELNEDIGARKTDPVAMEIYNNYIEMCQKVDDHFSGKKKYRRSKQRVVIKEANGEERIEEHGPENPDEYKPCMTIAMMMAEEGHYQFSSQARNAIGIHKKTYDLKQIENEVGKENVSRVTELENEVSELKQMMKQLLEKSDDNG